MNYDEWIMFLKPPQEKKAVKEYTDLRQIKKKKKELRLECHH